MRIDTAGPAPRAALAGAALGVLATLEAGTAVVAEHGCATPYCLPDVELLIILTALPVFVLLGWALLHRAGVERGLRTAFGAGALATPLLLSVALSK
ncbi:MULTISPECIES: hypothetical protein [Kitasatospora]|uniref:Uncharacterized protein n=1 Tax=Kitasatospora setae (strain ATCC 33774 / DSM 43861 / JCM 3304 / KCC A-0304 / NBRC 14216 / KM-6054) TaxID=452652 RepID=E4N2S2_KITSK|nr:MULTISPECIES: hypothetical protein [Kitasatospora]BAJ32456.1 hypothetical protein KSE_66980 [Kitasatospora setae KM-6054]